MGTRGDANGGSSAPPPPTVEEIALAALRQAKLLVTRGWTQWIPKTSDGKCFCAARAIIEAAQALERGGKGEAVSVLATKALAEVIRAPDAGVAAMSVGDAIRIVQRWNDQDIQTQKSVIEGFTRAISLLNGRLEVGRLAARANESGEHA